MTILNSAEDKIKAARSSMMLDAPFFGSIMLRMNFKEDNTIPTLATDIYHTSKMIMFNRAFVESLPQSQLKGGLVHEIMHVIMAHALRRDNRGHIKWNLAGDYAINLVIKDAGFELPNSKDFKPLLDEKYRDWSAEKIYDSLPEPKVIKITISQQGQGEEGDGDNKGGGKGYVQAEVEGHDGHTCGGMNDPKGEDGRGLTESERAAVQAEINSIVAEAATIAKAAGNMPGSLQYLVDSMLESKVDWREQLRMFFERITKNDYSWQMPNRRYLAQNIYLPSLYSRNIGTIVVAIDTSGSVSDKLLDQFASEVSGMLDSVDLEKVIVLHCDTQIQAIEEYEKEDLPLMMEAKGRGGTYFGPVFKYIEDNNLEPTCLVYQTDLYPGDSYPETPAYPVIWVAADANPEDPPFGEVIRLD